MHLNSNMDHTPAEQEVEVIRINANRMERCSLLHDGVIDSVQDALFCLAGFTYSQQITARVSRTVMRGLYFHFLYFYLSRVLLQSVM
jgi:hypothetical protein